MRFILAVIIYLTFSFHWSFSQELWDDDSVKAQKIYYSLSEALQNPDSVYRLDLSKQKLSEIPAGVFELKNLIQLKANKNRITEIPAEIEKLRLLQEISFNNNKIRRIPPQIGKLKNLRYIHMNRNLIEEVPDEIGQLFNLEELHLWDNEIGVISDDIRFCSSLRMLELRGILFSSEQQKHVIELLPYTKVFFSPSCNCKN